MNLTGFLPRIVALLLLIQLPIWVLADALAPEMGAFFYEPITKSVLDDLTGADRRKDAKRLSELAQKYDLSWVHLADKKKSLSSRPAQLPPPFEGSKVLELKGKRHVELSRLLPGGAMLSVGFCCPSLIEFLSKENMLPASLPLATVCLALFLNLATLAVSYLFCLGLPLHKTIYRLARGEDPPESFPLYVSSELSQITEALRERFQNLQQTHEKNISSARNDLSGAFAKEVEDRFINKLSKSMIELDNYAELNILMIHRLADEFIGVIKAGFALHLSADGSAAVSYSWGFTEEQGKVLSALPASPFSKLLRKMSRPVFMAHDELADKKLETVLLDLSCDQCLVFANDQSGQTRTSLCFFVSSKDQQSFQKLEKLVERMGEQLTPVWNLLSSYQDMAFLSRHDWLTGMGNRILLDEYFLASQYKQNESDGKAETAYLVFEGDGFRLLLNSYGPRTIDKLIQEFSQTLLIALEESVRYKSAKSKIQFANYLYRVGGCKFLLVLESSNLKKASELAESVCKYIAERKDWAHGLPSWSASCGIAVSENNAKPPDDSFEEALLTLEFIRSRKSMALVLNSSEVPDEFMSKAHGRNLGSLARQSGQAILQDMDKNKKTGILTATGAGGQVFWAFIENGRAAKARLGKLCGDFAVVEFISTFAECSYRLQDLASLDAQSSADLRNLGGAYLVKTAASEILDLSVKFRDSAADARVHLKAADMIVHPTMDRHSVQIEQVFFKAGKTPHKLYLEVANAFWENCNGRHSLDEIMQKMEADYPLSIVWTAADFLMQAKMIKFSRLRVSVHTDPERDAQAAAQRAQAAAGGAASAQTKAQVETVADVFVPANRVCSSCKAVDPLSQKFCVHCGAEMIEMENSAD